MHKDYIYGLKRATAIVGTAVALLFLAYKEKSLVIVALGSICTVFLASLILP